MRDIFLFTTWVIIMTVGYNNVTWAMADNLTLNSHQCKMPDDPVPKLPPKLRSETENWDVERVIISDLNGDGWCDYALGIPFPFSSQMNTFTLDEMVRLGSRDGWKVPLHGGSVTGEAIDIRYDKKYPFFRVDLTDIHMIYPAAGGAPYIVGLFTSGLPGMDAKDYVTKNSDCRQYNSVYRWDDINDMFKRVADETANQILNFYYSHVESPCDAGSRVGD